MSLLDVICDMQTASPGDGNADGTYTVTRQAQGTYDSNGYFSGGGAVTTLKIVAIIVPLDGRELVVVPEGLRTQEQRKILTGTRLMTVTPTTVPDIVTIGGDPFAVYRCDGPFTLDGDSTYTAYAARQKTT